MVFVIHSICLGIRNACLCTIYMHLYRYCQVTKGVCSMRKLVMDRTRFVNLVVYVELLPIHLQAFYQLEAVFVIEPNTREEATDSLNAVLKLEFEGREGNERQPQARCDLFC